MTGEFPTCAELLGATLRTLSHELRSPLSVVSNELQYLASRLPAEECARAQRRCQEVSDLLRQMCGMSSEPLCKSCVKIDDCLTSCDRSAESFSSFTDANRVRELSIFVERLLQRAGNGSITCTVDSTKHSVTWRSAVADPPALANGAEYRSCTSYFLRALGMEAPEASIVDALACSLELELRVLPSAERLEIEACFPRGAAQ